MALGSIRPCGGAQRRSTQETSSCGGAQRRSTQETSSCGGAQRRSTQETSSCGGARATRLLGGIGVLLGLALATPANAQEPVDETPAAAASEVELPSEAPSLDVPSRVSDEEVQATLERVFQEVPRFSSITVEVRDGVVHLGGTTATAEAQERAEALARRMPGVLFVDSAIESESDVAERLEPVLLRLERAARDVAARLPVLGVALFVMLVAALIARFVRRREWPFASIASTQLMQGILRQVAAGVVLLLGLLLAIELLDATAVVGALLGALGVFGVTVGLGSRDIFENYLATLVLAMRHPFAIDDLVRIDDHEGKVARLTSRETVLMTLDGNHLRLPNALVFKSVIINYTQNPLRSFSFELPVPADEDLARAQRVAAAGTHRVPGVLDEPPPVCRVDSIGPAGAVLRVFAWVDQRETDWFAARSEGLREVRQAFDEAGIALPAPRVEVDMRRGRVEEPHPRGIVPEAPADAPIERKIAEQIHAEQAGKRQQNLLERPHERS